LSDIVLIKKILPLERVVQLSCNCFCFWQSQLQTNRAALSSALPSSLSPDSSCYQQGLQALYYREH